MVHESESAASIANAFKAAINRDAKALTNLPKSDEKTLSEFAALISRLPSPPELFLFDSALALVNEGVLAARPPDIAFITNSSRDSRCRVYSGTDTTLGPLETKDLLKATTSVNRSLRELQDLSKAFRAPVFELLGLRNLSSFVGEAFKNQLYEVMRGRVFPNPNQDGYPDLLALTTKGKKYIDDAKKDGRLSDKRLWSPFPYGGIEIKATCGDTPPACKLAKPLIGETRLGIAVGLSWKAHHRSTNNLLAIYWDFVDGYPAVLGLFYRNDLTEAHWGAIVAPKPGGGNTTSVSIMKRSGVVRMGEGWLLLPAEAKRRDQLRALVGNPKF